MLIDLKLTATVGGILYIKIKYGEKFTYYNEITKNLI
jgi:hypothetical protein